MSSHNLKSRDSWLVIIEQDKIKAKFICFKKGLDEFKKCSFPLIRVFLKKGMSRLTRTFYSFALLLLMRRKL
jgi:hypothetical protein